MNKLDLFERAVVFGAVWVATLIGKLIASPDGIRYFGESFWPIARSIFWSGGSSFWSIILALAAVGLLSRHRQSLSISNGPTTHR
jgi:hypothetical protein